MICLMMCMPFWLQLCVCVRVCARATGGSRLCQIIHLIDPFALLWTIAPILREVGFGLRVFRTSGFGFVASAIW